MARCEGAMPVALRDVESSLAAYGRPQRLQVAAESSRAAKDLAGELYARGLSDFLSVDDAQRAQFAAEDGLARSRTAVATDPASLCKALGGGWQEGLRK
jgi:outer membrane protein, multidrug efflux system